MIARRAELLAELFLQELQPLFVAQSTGESGYDFFVGFRNPKGGVNNILVEVKSTEPSHGNNTHFPKRLTRNMHIRIYRHFFL